MTNSIPNETAASSASSTSSSAEQVSPGVSREWICEGRIVVYTVHNSLRESADAWAEVFKSDVAAWPAEKPFLAIHDLSAKEIPSTPYGRDRATEMADFRPEVKGRIAILLPNTFASSLIRLFLSQNSKASRTRRVFTSRDEAVQWLLS